jgi:septal ring factor EnvC (AmiA/AmiB activator)
MTKDELFDYINESTRELDKNLDLDSLKDIKKAVNKLQDILPDELLEARTEAGSLQDEIKECESVIEKNKLTLRGFNSKISSMSSDITFCDRLLRKIKSQQELAQFNMELDYLIDKSQSFEDAFEDRLVAYQDLRETNAFIIDDEKVDLSPALKVAEGYLNPDPRFMPNQDWYAARKTYEANIRELCELRVKGMAITLSKSKERFVVIDNLIAQYEVELFRNVKTS